MAVGIRIKLAGITEEQLDAVNKHVDPAADPPKGLLFHASGPTEEGWGVINFWESRQDFDAFEPRIGAAVAAAGAQLQGRPDIKQFSVHDAGANRECPPGPASSGGRSAPLSDESEVDRQCAEAQLRRKVPGGLIVNPPVMSAPRRRDPVGI